MKEKIDQKDNLSIYEANESDWEDFWYNEDGRTQTSTLCDRGKMSGDD